MVSPIILVGFFSSRDATVPGNMAVLDWIEALNWVRRYIRYFGGDPNRITIAGHSAGSEAVSFLTLSPLSRSLFGRLLVFENIFQISSNKQSCKAVAHGVPRLCPIRN